MLDLKFVRENIDLVQQNIKNKNESVDVTALPQLDEKRRTIIAEVENLKNLRNTASKEIALLKRNKENADNKIAEMKEVSDKIKDMDDELREVENQIAELMSKVPNMCHKDVPVGKTEADNVVVKEWGERVTQPIKKDHIEIAKDRKIIDFERGAKVSGAGFAFYTGKGAALERALINFFLNTHLEKHGYYEMMPPFLVNENSMRGTGQLPKMAEDMYHATEDNMYLIPTAEVPLTNYYNNEIIREELPIKICGYSPCFRREAGSYGKEVHGFLRVHQFNKVELVKFTKPEDSYNELEKLIKDAEDLLQALGLEYRLLHLCSGDTSFSSASTFDLEVWAPGEEKWLEVSSCSNFEDFQGRRANIRFKREPNAKPEFVHTLNGSALATSRIFAALIETYLQEDGTVKVPECLQRYTGFDTI